MSYINSSGPNAGYRTFTSSSDASLRRLGQSLKKNLEASTKIKFNWNLWLAVAIVSAAAIIPTALGVAQYTTAPKGTRTKKQYQFYVAQSVFLSFATVGVAIGLIMYGYARMAESGKSAY